MMWLCRRSSSLFQPIPSAAGIFPVPARLVGKEVLWRRQQPQQRVAQWRTVGSHIQTSLLDHAHLGPLVAP